MSTLSFKIVSDRDVVPDLMALGGRRRTSGTEIYLARRVRRLIRYLRIISMSYVRSYW